MRRLGLFASLMCLPFACGPTTSVLSAGTEGSSSTTDTRGDPTTEDPTAADVTTNPTTPGTTASPTTAETADEGPPLDTDSFGCPFGDNCDISEYCDEGLGVCVPKPEAPPECEAGRVTLVEDTTVEAPPGVLALGLANTDGAGGRELVAVSAAGIVEIRTVALEPIATFELDFEVADALVAGRGGDGFGRIWARRAADSHMMALTGDGLFGFDAAELGVVGGAMTAADLDGDDDTDLAVVADGAVQLVMAGDTLAPGAILAPGFAARSLGSTRGDDGVDLLVGGDAALVRLRSDGAGGFGAPESVDLLHAADAVGAFGNDFSAGIFALGFGDDASISMARGDAPPWRWLLPEATVTVAAAIADYGDPDSLADVLLVGGSGGITVVVGPGTDLPCRAHFVGPSVRAVLPGASSPIIATDAGLTRMLLQ